MSLSLDLPLSSYWVVPGSFMAGAHPGFDGEHRTRPTLLALLSLGIELFVDLTESGECVDYEPMLAGEPELAARPSHYWRVALRDMSIPSTQRMREVLDRIDAARSSGCPLYVHCLGGLGRTGTVVGCHLVRGGLTGDEALDRIEALRVGLVGAFALSPVTHQQRRFVREWRVGR